MISILSHSHYFHAIPEGESLPSLDAELKVLCRKPLRRIDRFIQLALMGSGRCVAGRALSPRCALYVGSGFGPAGNNIVVQETLFKQKLMPKPFNFVNTLGSSSGFYVADNLGLSGQTIFVTHRGASTEAALMAAVSDLELGITDQVLVGIVEECTLPLADHRRRHELSPDQLMAEGSHWLLLQAGDAADKVATLELRDVAAAPEGAILAGVAGRGISHGYHDSLVGAELAVFLQDKKTGVLVINSGKFKFVIQNCKP